MKHRTKLSLLACIPITAALLTAETKAAITATAAEISGDVIFTATGSINTTGLDLSNIAFGTPHLLQPGRGQFSVGVQPYNFLFETGLVASIIPIASGPSAIGPFSNTVFTPTLILGQGAFALFEGSIFYLPVSYISGSEIPSGSTIYGSQTLASLLIPEGTYVWSLANGETITLNAIPEASTTILLGLGGLFASTRRRRAV